MRWRSSLYFVFELIPPIQDGSDQSDKDVVVDDDISPDDAVTARSTSPISRPVVTEDRR